MPDTLDLEITLSHSEADGYQAELQAHNLLGEVSRSLIAPIQLDLEALRQSRPDRDASEALLAAAIFNEPRLRAGLQDAIAAALPDRSLRLRLRIDASAPELLFLNQDVLLDPRDMRNFDYLPVGERLSIANEQAEQQRRVNRRLRIALVGLALLCIAALAVGALAVLNNRGILPNLAQARPGSGSGIHRADPGCPGASHRHQRARRRIKRQSLCSRPARHAGRPGNRSDGQAAAAGCQCY